MSVIIKNKLDGKPLVKRLYTHCLDIEKIGIRKDGSTYERFEVYLQEDVKAAVERLFELLFESHGSETGGTMGEYNEMLRQAFPDIYKKEKN